MDKFRSHSQTGIFHILFSHTLFSPIFSLPILLSLWFLSPAVAAYYQWKDDGGVVHLTNDPAGIPEKYRGRAKEVPFPDRTVPQEPPSSSGTAASQEVPPSRNEVDSQGHDRAWWQARVKEWKGKKEEAEQNLSDAKGRLNKLLALTSPTLARRQKETEIREEIKKYEEALQEANQMLNERLPEEARKGGALPGWLRD
ncbi:MAG: DUF4124 domain-containing protein [Candidatus Manganitrophaceae bacterium]